MERQYAKKHTGRRALAVLLSLLMLLQSVSAFADGIDVPETNPGETIESVAQVPEVPEENNIVPAENPAAPETVPAESPETDAQNPVTQPESVTAPETVADALETADKAPETLPDDTPAKTEQTAETPAENNDVPADTPDIPAAGAEEPAETTEIPADNPEALAVNEEEAPAGDSETPADTAEIPADDNRSPEKNAEIPAEEAVPEPTPIIDTSESITMLQAGFVPAPIYFEGTLVHEGADYTVTAVIGQDAMFPADVSMRVEEILPGTELYEYYIRMMEETMEADEEMGEFARFFDIAFIADVDGETAEIEPQADIDVQITYREAITVTEETDVQAVHIEDDMPQILDASTDSLEAAVHDDEAIDTVSFSSDSFSVYGVYQKVKKILKVITASGETFTIDVTFTSDSGIPDDADLSAREITPEDPEYEELRTQAVLALDAGDVGSAHFFDIEISKDGEKIEPAGPVNVTIALDEMPEGAENVAVVHFGDGSTEIIENVEISDTDVQFQADSFSVYGVITDPTNEVNNLNGRIATIGRNGEYLTAETLNTTPLMLGKTRDTSQAAEYYFVSTGEAGQYYIYTIDPETQAKKYINFRYRGGQSAEADCFLSEVPQPLNVEQFGNDYRISWHYGSVNFALDYWQGGGGPGFGGYLVGSGGGVSDNHRMNLNFVTGGSQSAGTKYVVIVKYLNEYYSVQSDGSLVPCVYHPDSNLVEIESPLMWTYSSVYGNNSAPYNLKISEEAIRFDYDMLPTEFSYRYIDPNTDSGISVEEVHGSGNNKYADSLAEACRMAYENHKIYGLEHNSTNYLGVTEELGKLKISGNNDEASAAEVYFAIPMLPSSAYGTTNAVNHIDISVSGKANMNLAFAYGTYYDEYGNTIVIDKDHPYTYSVTNYPIAIKQEDMVTSEITAYKMNEDGSTTPLDDMFYVTGYSNNGANEGPTEADQVRIEGFFKVSYTNVPGQNGNYESQQARKATPVYYTVTVPKNVSVPLEYHGRKVYSENPVTNPDAKPVEVSTTVTLSSSFTYWDYDNNKCPMCVNNHWPWSQGDIPEGGENNRSGSGMDFTLGDQGNSGTIALEVIKYIVDEHGNPIRVSSEPKYSFDLYYTQDKNANYAAQYSGATPASVLDTLDLDSYVSLRTKTIQVGANGSGTLYDYDVSSLLTSEHPYALFYIRENADSIDRTIVDENGEEWEYTGNTRIVTEYVKRPHEAPDHEVNGLTAFPEVIGTFHVASGNGHGAGQYKTNAFLEFHVYNEYTNNKAEIQITKYLVEDGTTNLIHPMNPVENTFKLYRNNEAGSDDVIGINKGSYQSPFDTSAYTTEANLVSTEAVAVSTSGWGMTYLEGVSGKMYTVQEDEDSIDDVIVDTEGYIWEYKGTEILTEYVWRADGDQNQRHYSEPYTHGGNYTAIPEILGEYKGADGSDYFNAYLDFFVYNKYQKTNNKVESTTMDLQLNKLWNKNGDNTPLTSGTVTFLLHQIKTTTYTPSGGGQNIGTGNVLVELYSSDGTLLGVRRGNVNDRIVYEFTAQANRGADVYVRNRYFYYNEYASEYRDVYLCHAQTNGSGEGSFSYTIDSRDVADGKVALYLRERLNGFELTSGNASEPEPTVTTEVDPIGSGFPMEIVLTPADNWTALKEDLLLQVARENSTTDYSYYLQEIGRTGKAASYPIVTYENNKGMDADNAVAGEGTQTVNVTNTYDSTIPEDKLITIEKIWEDQDGNPLVIHPSEILVDIWRMKLPGTASTSGNIAFNSVGGPYEVIGQPTTWQDNGNEIQTDVVFYYNGYYYYVREGQFIFNRAQLQEWISKLDQGQMDGDHTTRLTGNVWTIEEVKEKASNNVLIERGDICLYNGDYYVFRHTAGAFGTSGHTWGPDVDGNWSKIGTANILSGVTIDLMPNDQYLTEEYIRNYTIPDLYEFIDQQREESGTGIQWSDADKTLVLYQENLSITEAMGWESVFRVDTGYLYFVFEKAIPGYTTTYGYEEYGVYDQEHNIEIVNTTTRGELDVTKTWTGENSADCVYFIVQRNGDDDITLDIANAPGNYGLTSENVHLEGQDIWLKLTKTSETWDTVQIKNLMLADYGTISPNDDVPYKYTVKEIGYHDANGDHWNVGEVLTGYSMSQQGGTATDTDDTVSGGVELGTTPSTITIHNETPTDFSFTKVWKKNGEIIAWPAQQTITVIMNAYTDAENPDVKALTDSTYTLSPDSHTGWTTSANTDGSVTFTISGLKAFDDDGNALTYYVKEVAIEGYSTTYADASGNKIESGNRALNGQQIINTKNIDVQVIKRNKTTGELMTGAEFRLDRKKDDDSGYDAGTPKSVGEDGTLFGMLVFEGLSDGEYRITETKAPAGYMPLASPIKFTIEQGQVTDVIAGSETLVHYTPATDNDPATFIVDNKPGVALPSTGGSGTAPYTLAGFALMALAGIALVKRKRKAH